MAVEYQAALLAAAVGATGVQFPDLAARRAAFDAELEAEQKPSDPRRDLVLAALGAA